MHDTGIAERIVEVAAARALAAEAVRVTDLNLELGPEAGFSRESVAFHLEEASHGTPVEGARINFLPTEDPRALRLVSIDVEETPAPSA